MRWRDVGAASIPDTLLWDGGEVRPEDDHGDSFWNGSPFIEYLLEDTIFTVTIFPTSSACFGSSTCNNVHKLETWSYIISLGGKKRVEAAH
jgi:hypothetical protein